MKKKLIGVLLIISIGIGGGGFFVFQNIQKPFLSDEDITIEVKDGESLSSIIAELNKNGKLKNELITKVYIKINGKKVNLAKGVYSIKKDSSMEEFLGVLSDPNAGQQSVIVTVPEGYNIEKIAELLEKNDLITSEEFIEAVKSYELPEYIPDVKDKRYNLEGYLYPDTYSFSKNMSGKDIIDAMLKQFNKIIEDIERSKDVVIKRENLDKIVIKASMIENEAACDEERGIIASVINNRIAADMTLGIDAAVTYGIGEHLEKVYYKHLDQITPYNTYRIKGLPVGAISSPGKKSLEAAIDPARTDYKFYLLVPGTKEHYFTNDYADFDKKYQEYKDKY